MVNALTEEETAELLKLPRSPRFVDLAPAQVWAIARRRRLVCGVDLHDVSSVAGVRRGPRGPSPGHPPDPSPPTAAWINKPTIENDARTKS